jgi:hypothetical protein
MFMDRLAELVGTPKGRRLLREAKRLTHDPARRADIDEAGRRLAAQRPPKPAGPMAGSTRKA